MNVFKSLIWLSLFPLCVKGQQKMLPASGRTASEINRSSMAMFEALGSQGNPFTLADPTIFLDKGVYYLYGTGSNKGFKVYESEDLQHWKGPVGKRDGYALIKGDAFGNAGFWAPQVFKYKEAYYMAYTADEQIAIAKSDSPLGPFKQEVLKPLPGLGRQIDPFVFFDTNGKIYLFYVKLEDGNRIYVAEMKADLSAVIAESAKECIHSTMPWENADHPAWRVTEGPTVIQRGNLYYMIYSANDFRSKDYAVGYATAASPFGPWEKYAGNPIIRREKVGYSGTGHGDLFTDKSGHYKYVLHVHYSAAKVAPRLSGLVDLTFLKGTHEDVLKIDEASFRFLYHKKSYTENK